MVKELDKRSDYPKAFWYMYSIITVDCILIFLSIEKKRQNYIS